MHVPSTWYTYGPSVLFLPLPVWWIWTDHGEVPIVKICHYLRPEGMLHNHSYVVFSFTICGNSAVFQLKGQKPTEDELTIIAQKVLLPTSEVQKWLDHLHEVQRN